MAIAKLLGIDVGTSSAKAVLVDAGGEVLALASRDHPTYMPAPGQREQQAEDWWQGAAASIRPANLENGRDCSHILPGPSRLAKKKP